MIYTSYFAQLANLPDSIVPVSICGKTPYWYKGLQYKKLAPKYSFFQEWKKTKDNNYYIEHYNIEVLNSLDAKQVFAELKTLTDPNDICLMCYERPTGFCHRHLVAEWLRNHGVEYEEFRS